MNENGKCRSPPTAAGSSFADDQTSSGSNRTGNNWVGVTKRTGLPDQTVFTFNANTDISYVGNNANDKIDHFNVR